jgi:peptidoglycan/LPS O-acetylase OafA/YrhL
MPTPPTVSQLWESRIGATACGHLERRSRYRKASVLLVFLAVVGAIISTDLEFPPGLLVSIVLVPAAAIVTGVVSARALRAARADAAVFVGLPAAAARELPLESTARFDDWLGRRRPA